VGGIIEEEVMTHIDKDDVEKLIARLMLVRELI